jgi:hypothetical protein
MQGIGAGFTEILMSLIEKGDDVSLKRAAIAMHSTEESNFGLSTEIARRTDNNDILSMVAPNMCATGVVSGEYGIANDFENKTRNLRNTKMIPVAVYGNSSRACFRALRKTRQGNASVRMRQNNYEGLNLKDNNKFPLLKIATLY